jgi:hypothetical protein
LRLAFRPLAHQVHHQVGVHRQVAPAYSDNGQQSQDQGSWAGGFVRLRLIGLGPGVVGLVLVVEFVEVHVLFRFTGEQDAPGRETAHCCGEAGLSDHRIPSIPNFV